MSNPRTLLYTSRYQHAAGILAAGLVPVRITSGPPRFRLGYALGGSVPALAPGRPLLRSVRASGNHAAFTAGYIAQLDAVGVDALARQFAAISTAHNGAGLVLLCFEDVHAGQHCHRRAFAAWWWEHTGEPVPELQADAAAPLQPSLF